MKKLINLLLLGAEETSHVPDLEVWLERHGTSVMVKASFSGSVNAWKVMELFDDFTYKAVGDLPRPFPTNRMKERKL